MWRGTAGRFADLPPGHEGRVQALALCPRADGTPLLLSAGEDGTVRAWDPLARTRLRTIPLGAPCRSLCVVPGDPGTPDARGVLVVGMDDGLLALDLAEMT
ncbi:hypothetical protein [Actinomadura sp. CNU-125]|uniref:hypothetical protein n=1 Tax=Actinomadura sp. CNU-125 TaxID=1904961 RepID=UPI001300DD30|nr:hypothetical protein [Actinomadura sp. CNU-125]